jgi:hypothetical protein
LTSERQSTIQPNEVDVARTTISDIATFPDGSEEALLGFVLEQPEPASEFGGYRLALDGWVLGAGSPVAWLQLSGPDIPPKRLPVNVDRPDVARANPDVPWAGKSGFRGGVGTLSLPHEFEIQLQALFADDSRAQLGTIRGRRHLPRLGDGDARLQPLIVTTLGRTGSTWLTGLLGQHPEIIAWGPYRYEPRAAPYWMDVLAALSEPQSYQQLVAPDVYGPEWWLGTRRQLAQNPMRHDPQMRYWLESGYVEGLIRLCKRQIEDFYRHAVSPERFEQASHFVEKIWPGSPAQGMLADLYPGMREVFLVRDYRDMACSVYAFSERLGFQSFGRQHVQSDEDYISGPLLESANLVLEMWKRCRHRAHLVRYEDLVTETAGTLGELLDYVGVDSSNETVERMISTGVSSDALGVHMTAPSVSETVGRWRKDLDDSVKRRFAQHFGEVLSEFGYDET